MSVRDAAAKMDAKRAKHRGKFAKRRAKLTAKREASREIREASRGFQNGSHRDTETQRPCATVPLCEKNKMTTET